MCGCCIVAVVHSGRHCLIACLIQVLCFISFWLCPFAINSIIRFNYTMINLIRFDCIICLLVWAIRLQWLRLLEVRWTWWTDWDTRCSCRCSRPARRTWESRDQGRRDSGADVPALERTESVNRAHNWLITINQLTSDQLRRGVGEDEILVAWLRLEHLEKSISKLR